MGEYIVSARKYRPQTFHSVVGQAALTATLKNAIANHRLAHAYLFCGPRGVGKTTCARIFAKAINCMNPKADGEACEECESCRGFDEQRSFNIHELDAASNNSVDDIRNLVDQVRIPPQVGKYSVYIVDEVHMLTTSAFNAFLKTLEEPPAHAIFILATTEKHKIIPTILSRCQIYDFNRIKVSDTISHLQYVAKSEGVEAEEMALNVIAQKADGAMRDALSIFDQVVSFCGNKITYQGVIENLNVLDFDYYFRLVDLLLESNVSKSLLIFDEILNKGFDAQFFVGGFASHLRDVLVSKDAETTALLEVSESVAQRYAQQAKVCSDNWLYRAIELANDCDINYRTSRNRRLLVEVMIIRIAGLKRGDGELKKVEPELPLIAVAPTLVLSQSNATANSITQQVIPKSQERSVNSTMKKPQMLSLRASYGTEEVAKNVNITSVSSKPNIQVVDHCSDGNENTLSVVTDTSVCSFDNVLSLWNEYANSLDKEAYVTSMMINFPPISLQRNILEIKLVNEIQVESLAQHKREIERFYESKNCNIRLNIDVDTKVVKNELFTDSEKFKNLIEKNSIFNEFKNALKLDL